MVLLDMTTLDEFAYLDTNMSSFFKYLEEEIEQERYNTFQAKIDAAWEEYFALQNRIVDEQDMT